MKRIVIVGWSYSMNYGTVLQAVALYTYLKKNAGTEYECVMFEGTGRRISVQNISDRIHSVTHPIKVLLLDLINRNRSGITEISSKKKLKTAKINEFISKNIEYIRIDTKAQLIRNIEKDSIFIVGSDQLWNPYYLHDTKLLYFVPDEYRKASYATSVGVHDIPDRYKNKYSKWLKRFDYISVREEETSNTLGELLNKQIYTVLDPTLLISREEWEELACSKELGEKPHHNKYIFTYFVGSQYNYSDVISRYALDEGLDLVNIGCSDETLMMYGDEYEDAGIEDFINLVKNASVVMTDSFHATVFSIIFNKQFVDFSRFSESDDESQNSRIKSLLHMLALEERLLSPEECSVDRIQSIASEKINYLKVEKQLDKYRKRSIDYLDMVIER